MSVYSCHELAEDWQIAPKAPVLLAVSSNHSSLNFDNYGDMEHGLQSESSYPTQYPNVPDVFVSEASVNPGDDWATVQAAMNTIPEGGVLWFEDGEYDFTAHEGPFLDWSNPNGTIENPVYVLARNKHQAIWVGNSGGIREFQGHSVMGGFEYRNLTAEANRVDIVSPRASWNRMTSMLMKSSDSGAIMSSAGLVNVHDGQNHFEIDNCEVDDEGQENTRNHVFKFLSNTAIQDPQFTSNLKHIRVHHNHLKNNCLLPVCLDEYIRGFPNS